MKNKLLNGDCLELMKSIPDKSIDMILCDLPYGTTACKWDTIIPFEPLWEQYKRVIKDNGAIVLTASQPFTSALIMSNINMFKYDIIWNKKNTTGFLNSKKMQLRKHEEILIFSKAKNGKYTYNPIMTKGKLRLKGRVINSEQRVYGSHKASITINDTYYPTSVIELAQKKQRNGHPTQKPVALFEYLIKTYSNENDLILDNTAGSGTTAIACLNTNRNYICMEKDKTYFDIMTKRVEDHKKTLKLF
jgi:site-specific DNA-methyltransferase (adenine-specific)